MLQLAGAWGVPLRWGVSCLLQRERESADESHVLLLLAAAGSSRRPAARGRWLGPSTHAAAGETGVARLWRGSFPSEPFT